jgi:hypothetical protein
LAALDVVAQPPTSSLGWMDRVRYVSLVLRRGFVDGLPALVDKSLNDHRRRRRALALAATPDWKQIERLAQHLSVPLIVCVSVPPL